MPNSKLVHVQMPDETKRLLKQLVEAIEFQPDRLKIVEKALEEAKVYLGKDEKANV